MRQRMPREKLDRHLEFIRSLPCICCGDNTATEACHIRMSDARIAKFNAGVGQKPDDYFTVPMCGQHHREQHAGSELKFWLRYRIDPTLYALRLWSVTGNHEMGCEIVAAARPPANVLAAG